MGLIFYHCFKVYASFLVYAWYLFDMFNFLSGYKLRNTNMVYAKLAVFSKNMLLITLF